MHTGFYDEIFMKAFAWIAYNKIKWVCLWNRNAPGCNNVQYRLILSIKDRNVIDLGVIWKGFISWLCMPNMESLSFMFQKLWPILTFFATESNNHRQTGRKSHRQIDRRTGKNVRCPRIPFRDHNTTYPLFANVRPYGLYQANTSMIFVVSCLSL